MTNKKGLPSLLLFFNLMFQAKDTFGTMASTPNIAKPRVCVIGAGIGGLSSARHLKDAGIEYVVLESTNYVGGIWHNDEGVASDEFNRPTHSNMFEDSRAALPKVSMELPDFPLPVNASSFVSRGLYYDYLKAFTKHFQLEKYIKFLHKVISVKRMANKWKITYKHVAIDKVFYANFDYVIVASGRYSRTYIPLIPGQLLFKGTATHSHHYRGADPYKCRRVLIIGTGPPAMDIAIDVAAISKTVVHSHQSKFRFRTPFPPNYKLKKQVVKEINQTGVIFDDGTYEAVDDIIYCTGYEFYYPFLDETSGLTISRQMLTPLHKNIININQPTMFILGAIFHASLVIALDAQARYVVALIKGNFRAPSREDMIRELETRYSALREQNRPLHLIHVLAAKEGKYYAELAAESGIEKVKPVIPKINMAQLASIINNAYTHRNYVYTVVDDDTFNRTLTDDKIPTRNVTCPDGS